MSFSNFFLFKENACAIYFLEKKILIFFQYILSINLFDDSNKSEEKYKMYLLELRRDAPYLFVFASNKKKLYGKIIFYEIVVQTDIKCFLFR